MISAAEQYQMLTSIWPKWRSVAESVAPDAGAQPVMKRRATMAVKALYQYYDREAPTIVWHDDPSVLEIPEHPPFVCHFRESLIYSVWHKLAEPSWVCSQVGYDRRQHVFRLPANKRVVLGRSRITPTPRNRRRPSWLQHTLNVVSQFDVDALAIVELASALGRVDQQIAKLATIIERIATSCFAAITFDDCCVLVEKPHTVIIDEGQQLSAQGRPAIAWQSSSKGPGIDFYAINGEIIGVNDPPVRNWAIAHLLNTTPRNRALLIEYIGWDNFFKMVVNHPQQFPHQIRTERIDKHNKYGSLYRIWFPNQEFLVLRVKNRTPEPDGSFRRHVIPIDPLCRPLPHPNKPHERLGEPQMLTARNAVASTFHMTGEEYEDILGAES